MIATLVSRSIVLRWALYAALPVALGSLFINYALYGWNLTCFLTTPFSNIFSFGGPTLASYPGLLLRNCIVVAAAIAIWTGVARVLPGIDRTRMSIAVTFATTVLVVELLEHAFAPGWAPNDSLSYLRAELNNYFECGRSFVADALVLAGAALTPRMFMHSLGPGTLRPTGQDKSR